MQLSEFLSRVPGKKHQRGDKWDCLCPAHGDKHPSLLVSMGEKGIVATCQRGCTIQEICGAIGVEVKELFKENGRGREERPRPRNAGHAVISDDKIACSYDYVNANGVLLYQVCRMKPTPEREKAFVQRRPDLKRPGCFICGREDIPEVLYRLPEVLQAQKEHGGLYVVEGEKDVETLRALGRVATCNTGGAGKGKWHPEYNECLRGCHVFVIPDNDKVGSEHAEGIVTGLAGVAASVRLVRLPGLNEKGDVTDWIGLGHTIAELDELAWSMKPEEPPPWESYPGPALTLVDLREPPKPLDWLIDGVLIKAMVAGLTAPGGTGKSFLMLQMLYHMAWGKDWGPFRPTRPLRSLILAGEDNQRVIDMRLWRIGNGHYPNGYHVTSVAGRCGPLMESAKFGLAEKSKWWEWLNRTLDLYQDLDILVLDPRSRFYGLDENNNDFATQWSNAVEELISRHGCSIWTPHHVGKQAAGAELGAGRARGASAFHDACRMVLDMGGIDEKEAKKFGCSRKEVIKLDMVKNNNAPQWNEPVYFRRGEYGLLEPWTPVEVQLDAICQAIPLALAAHRGAVALRDVKHRLAKEFFAAVESRVKDISWDDLCQGVEKCLADEVIFERQRKGSSGQVVSTLSLMRQE